MRRLRAVVAIALLALWLPATLHCELETLGVFAACEHCHDDADGATEESGADGCATVENGGYRIDAFVLKAPEAPFLLVLFVVPPPDGEARSTGDWDATAAPLHVRRTWQFAARAAPPSRAPALLG